MKTLTRFLVGGGLLALAFAVAPRVDGQATPGDAPLPGSQPVIDVSSPEQALYRIAVPDLGGTAGLGSQGAGVLRSDFAPMFARSAAATATRATTCPSCWRAVRSGRDSSSSSTSVPTTISCSASVTRSGWSAAPSATRASIPVRSARSSCSGSGHRSAKAPPTQLERHQIVGPNRTSSTTKQRQPAGASSTLTSADA